MEQRLTMITLGVADLQRATEFYESAFGWKKSEASNEHITFFTLNEIQLALFAGSALAEDAGVEEPSTGFKGFAIAHNVRSEKEVDELVVALRAKGVPIVKEPERTNWGGYSGYVSDPDLNLWEIAFNPYLELDAKGNVRE